MKHKLGLIFAPLVLSLGASVAAQANDPEISARFSLWSRAACPLEPNAECGTPIPLRVEWSATFRFADPAPGRSLIGDQLFTAGDWRVRVQLFYVRPTPPEIPYLVTQIQLGHIRLGSIAGCTKYDDARNRVDLAPGSCSGVNGGTEYGISIFKARQPPDSRRARAVIDFPP